MGTAREGRATLESVAVHSPELVLLDVTLNQGEGYRVARQLCAREDIAVVLTSSSAVQSDRVRGLDLGADDFVPAPISAAELVARVGAVLRRSRRAARRPRLVADGRLLIDDTSGRACVDGKHVDLTALELKLLSYFLSHRDQVLSRERLLESVWGYTVGDGSTVTVFVGRLRAKLNAEGLPSVICTVRGQGYVFTPPPPSTPSP